MEPENQQLTFITMLLVGTLLGLMYDTYQVFWTRSRYKHFFTWLTDLLYWLVSFAIVALSLFFTNGGELRFYVFIGLIGGAAAYFRFASSYVTGLLLRLIRLFMACVRFFKNLLAFFLLRPLQQAGRLVGKPLAFIRRTAGNWYRHWQVPPEKK